MENCKSPGHLDPGVESKSNSIVHRLKNIFKGRAKGNKPALWLRARMQKAMFWLGNRIQTHYVGTLLLGLLLLILCCIGLNSMAIETNMEKLWIEMGGRLEAERKFLAENSPALPAAVTLDDLNAKYPAADGRPAAEPRPTSGGDAFLLIIQTPRKVGESVLNMDELLLHQRVVTEIAQLTVEMFGANWTLKDICFKPPAPVLEGGIGDLVRTLLDKLVPCTIISPLDCFWEGSKGLGPFPPVRLGPEVQVFVPSLSHEVSWKNLDPKAVVRELLSFGWFDLSNFESFLSRSGVDSGYQDRPCINPLDPECPRTAPNHVDICQVVDRIMQPDSPERRLILGSLTDAELEAFNTTQLTTDVGMTTTASMYDSEYGGLFDSLFNRTVEEPDDLESPLCKKYKEDVRSLLQKDHKLMRRWLPPGALINYASAMTGGCVGFAQRYMTWPEDLIIGGVKRKDGKIISADALQSVFMMAGVHEVFERFREGDHTRIKSAHASWSPAKAAAVMDAWQRKFTQYVYNHTNNTATNRQIHPMSGTSVNEMLEMFSEINPTVMLVGYFVMVLYASFSLFTAKDHGVASGVGLAICGCVLVTISNLAGLGSSMSLGIKFNPTTTQVVPFLTLGLGVDDMFLLLHNYRDIAGRQSCNEIGLLLQETGLSALLTSINNILAFLVGAVLPVPALRDFCLQVALVLTFNAITILTVYPACMAMDLLRRKKRLVDVFCCIRAPAKLKSPAEAAACVGLKSQVPPSYDKVNCATMDKNYQNNHNILQDESESSGCSACGRSSCTIEAFLEKFYLPALKLSGVKIVIAILGCTLFAIGAYGVTTIQLGLELTDLIPKGTAAYQFVAAREAYFSFFPFNAILKGPVDLPAKQNLVHEYRNRLAQLEYTVKQMGEITEKYWLSMMSDWLLSLQTKFDEDWLKGYLNRSGVISTQVSRDAKLAYKLMCNKGDIVDCSRVGAVRLVDSNGYINPDGFYNYLTAWFNLDQMSYYISQGNFYPTPPTWYNTEHIRTEEDKKVPPSPPLIVSHVPFFVTNLVDTPVIVDFIKKVRAICDEFTEKGLPNFPEGLPITFWEHYVHLNYYLLLSLSIICLAAFITISLMIFNPWAAGVVVGVVAITVFELAGIMGLYGLKLNPISVVTLITAVGIGVEFTVHMSLSFLTSVGSRNQRMYMAVHHMFVPVLHGGLSTLLGLLMLAFSEFEFIVQYFFYVMSSLILLGIFNGLVVFPVLLSWIGPPPEVQPIDGGDILPPPSPSTVIRYLSSPFNLCGSANHSSANRSGRHGSKRKSDMSLSTITEESSHPSNISSAVLSSKLEKPNNPVKTTTALDGLRNSIDGQTTNSGGHQALGSVVPNSSADGTAPDGR